MDNDKVLYLGFRCQMRGFGPENNLQHTSIGIERYFQGVCLLFKVLRTPKKEAQSPSPTPNGSQRVWNGPDRPKSFQPGFCRLNPGVGSYEGSCYGWQPPVAHFVWFLIAWAKGKWWKMKQKLQVHSFTYSPKVFKHQKMRRFQKKTYIYIYIYNIYTIYIWFLLIHCFFPAGKGYPLGASRKQL